MSLDDFVKVAAAREQYVFPPTVNGHAAVTALTEVTFSPMLRTVLAELAAQDVLEDLSSKIPTPKGMKRQE